ncbi:MAG: protein kinase [Polyangiaceae bacterium]
MTRPSDELLPIVTVSLFDREEIAGLVFSALDGSVALVPVNELPDGGRSFVLELRSPDRPKPLMLAGELAGDPAGGFCPMFLKPVDATNAEELLTFLGSVSERSETLLEKDGARSARAHMRILTPRASLPPPSPPVTGTDRRALMPAMELPDPATAPPAREQRMPILPGIPDTSSVIDGRHRSGPATANARGSGRAAPLPREEAPEEHDAPAHRDGGKNAITLQSIPGSTTPVEAPPQVAVIERTARVDRADPGERFVKPEPAPPTMPVPPPTVPRVGPPNLTCAEPDSRSSGPPSVTRDPLIGRSLGGKYTISALIGAGGAGSVYRARHVMLQKDIAIKVMHPSLRKDPTFGARFHAEALAASKLDHPNVLRVIDYGEEPDGLLYIAMELLVGTELRTLLWQGRMPLSRALDITCQICAALSAAAEVGIVHRDIKPENVVITSSRDDEGDTVDLVKVCDFGLAQIVKSGESKATSYVAGTPEYMSPEQVRGEELDGRSDIYAVGIVLYELLTGRVPFESEVAVEILRAHLQKPVVPPSKVAKDVDPEAEAIVLRTLAKDRAQRPGTAREVRAELRAILERLRRPAPAVANVPTPAAAPIEDPASAFGEMLMALTSAVARAPHEGHTSVTGAGQPITGPVHPEHTRALVRLVNATRTPLAGRGEITIAQRDPREPELLVYTGLGELLDLRRVVPVGVAEGYAPRLAESLGRRHVVSLTLREGVSEADLTDAIEMLAGPDVSADALRLDFLSRGLPGVSVLFLEEMLGKARKLPWNVDLCLSRMARDLRALPLLRGITEEGMRSQRAVIVEAATHVLERAEDVRVVLESSDLVAASVAHVPELEAFDLRETIVASLGWSLAVATARLLMSTVTRAASHPPPAEVHSNLRALLAPFASRFLHARADETDELLRAMIVARLVEIPDLPRDLQEAVAADRLAQAMATDPDLLFRRLAAAKDLVRYGDEIAAASRALASLAKAGDARTPGGGGGGLPRSRGEPAGGRYTGRPGGERGLVARRRDPRSPPSPTRLCPPRRATRARARRAGAARSRRGARPLERARPRRRRRALPAASLRGGAPRGGPPGAPGDRRAPLAHRSRERRREHRGRRGVRGGPLARAPGRLRRGARPRGRPLPPSPHAGGASRGCDRVAVAPRRAREAVADARDRRHRRGRARGGLRGHARDPRRRRGGGRARGAGAPRRRPRERRAPSQRRGRPRGGDGRRAPRRDPAPHARGPPEAPQRAQPLQELGRRRGAPRDDDGRARPLADRRPRRPQGSGSASERREGRGEEGPLRPARTEGLAVVTRGGVERGGGAPL